MKAKYLDDKLAILVKGDEYDIRDVAKIILKVTNGSLTGYRNENLLDVLLNGDPLTVGHYKTERVKICDGKIVYGFSFNGACADAEKAARNHYSVIKGLIQGMTGENCYRIKRKYG